MHEIIIWFNFNLVAVKVSCASKKTQQIGSSFSYSCGDAEPLSPEIQQKLRSKYLFDDDDEKEKVCKRNMIRSQSLNTSRKVPEKTVPSHQHESSALTSRKQFLNKLEKKPQERQGMVIDKRDTTARTCRPVSYTHLTLPTNREV